MWIKQSIARALSTAFAAKIKTAAGKLRRSWIRSFVKRLSPSTKLDRHIVNLEASLLNLRDNGFAPTSILDIGAHDGDWSVTASKYFANSTFHLFEALPEKEAALRSIGNKLGARNSLNLVLLGAEEKKAVTFYRMGTGSSVLPEVTGFPRTEISLPMTTLDHVVATRNIAGPYFLKLDTQGYEMEILRGATRVIQDTDAILLEMSLLEFNAGAPLFDELIVFMAERGFVPYDFCEFHRREADKVLFQCDVIFVRRNSFLREKRKFFRKEPTH